MKRRLAVLTIVAIGGFGTGIAPVAATAASAHTARAVVVAVPVKSCGAGYVHAALPWGHKCLRRGQYCKVSGDRYYHKYGFHCHTGRLK